MSNDPDLRERGLRVRREVLGDSYVDAALGNADGFGAEFQQLVTEYCWGLCWADETLERRDRSILNLGMTAALGRMEEFELHFRGALRNGLSEQELKAVLTQIAVYCGIPAGVNAFKLAGRVIAEHAAELDASAAGGQK